ncbi:MAG: glycosyltransferase, partial [Omnitrophica WOR_2 bacterium]
DEIQQELRLRGLYNPPSFVTGNGFDPDEIQLADFDPAARLELKTPVDAKVIIFTGSLQLWQGIDRLLPAISKFKDVYLWVIGGGDEQAILQKRAEQHHISARIRWVDWLSNQQLNRYMKASDLAVGPLALDRKRMEEAQPMKVRSYLGAGLPLLYGYYDTKIPDGLPWAQKVDATSLDSIIRGIQTLLLLPARSTIFRQEIRDYALRTLSWDAMASDTLGFIQHCLKIPG